MKKRKEDIITKLREYVIPNTNIQFAYLFGSYAENRQKENSDIDVAIYLTGIAENEFFKYKLDIKGKLEQLLQKPVDVVIMNDAPPLLNHEVFKNGVLIKDGDSVLTQFRVRNFYFYLDQMYIINRYLNAAKKRIRSESRG